MDLIGRILPFQVEVLDGLIIQLRYKVHESWNGMTWIRVFLQMLVREGLLTQQQRAEALFHMKRALDTPYTEPFPNRRRCFPDLE